MTPPRWWELSDFQAAVLRAWETGDAEALARLADYRRSTR